MIMRKIIKLKLPLLVDPKTPTCENTSRWGKPSAPVHGFLAHYDSLSDYSCPLPNTKQNLQLDPINFNLSEVGLIVKLLWSSIFCSRWRSANSYLCAWCVSMGLANVLSPWWSHSFSHTCSLVWPELILTRVGICAISCINGLYLKNFIYQDILDHAQPMYQIDFYIPTQLLPHYRVVLKFHLTWAYIPKVSKLWSIMVSSWTEDNSDISSNRDL